MFSFGGISIETLKIRLLQGKHNQLYVPSNSLRYH
jgi:hypothetical protein